MRQRFSSLIVMTFIPVFSALPEVYAQGAERTLDMIANTADRICGVVKEKGSATSAEARGVIRAELRGLASLTGTFGIGSDEYQGVVREQLGAVLRTNADCKFKVFLVLQEKLLPNYSYSDRFRNPRPLEADLPCNREQVASWLDRHGIYGNRPFDISIYHDHVNWVVNGRTHRKARSEIEKEEDIFKRLYPTQRYVPKTSSASMIGGQCVLTQEVEGYKRSSTGKVELNNFRFVFTIRNDSDGPRIVARQTDVLATRS
jgi:hypothetical protein